MNLTHYLDFALETAFLAGRLTLGYYQAGIRPDFKADDTPVTIADRKAEELIRQRIEQAYPGCAILGEEFGGENRPVAGLRWIIDPIDGTKSFVRGVPLFAVLLGLEIDGQVKVGAAYFPALDEMIAAASGLGCWWNGRRAHVSEVDKLERGLVVFTDLSSFARHGRQSAWDRVCDRAYYRAGWGDAYGYLLVATGRAEVMLDPVMNLWDAGPFPPIFAEAGGYFGDWRGNPTIYSREALATTSKLLSDVLATLSQVE